jgi:NO-binding membrane sensor protein with MHYT domain
MISAIAALPGSYDYGEVARSVFIAVAASYARLDFAGRVTAAAGRPPSLVERRRGCDGNWCLGDAP